MTTPIVEVEQAVKTFAIRKGFLSLGKLAAVDQVSFTVYPGEIVGLVGESGCGKSTMGRCILHLLPLDNGSIRFRGEEVGHLAESQFYPYRRRIQMVFQNPLSAFDPLFTVEESIRECLKLRNDLSHKEAKEEVIRLLQMVGLPPEFAPLKPHKMSGGQLQRVGVARALAPQPQFIFLDEPTSALDMSIRGQIINLLLDIQQATGVSYLFVAHNLRLIQAVADRVLVMYRGEIVEEAGKKELYDHPLHPYTQGLLAATFIGQKDGAKRKERLASLRGEVTYSEEAGCKLAPRCPFAQDRCFRESQTLNEIEPNHHVRCWRVAENNLI